MSKTKKRNVISTVASLGLSLAALLVGVSACSAGGADYEADSLGETQEAIGLSCAANAPSKTVNRGFSPAYTSEATYSDCYKGKIVRVDNYSDAYSIGGYTKVAWAGAVPSDDQCADSSVGAYLFRLGPNGWEHVIDKSAHGNLPSPLDNIPSDIEGVPHQVPVQLPPGPIVPVPKDPGLFGPIDRARPQCTPPVVYFYNDDMPMDGTYLIVASARLPGKVLQPLTFESVAGKCGHANQTCCTSGLACDAQEGFRCDGGSCKMAGVDGGLCWGDKSCNAGLQCDAGGRCRPCGVDGASCCNTGIKCGAGMSCNNSNKCEKPCGVPGNSCCPGVGFGCQLGSSCNAQNVCQKLPAACGTENLSCCSAGLPCAGDLICNASKKCVKPAAEPPSCGGIGGACCATTPSCDAPLVCLPTVSGGNACQTTPDNVPDSSCDAPNDNCCQGMIAGQFPYCSQRYFSNLHCENLTCVQ